MLLLFRCLKTWLPSTSQVWGSASLSDTAEAPLKRTTLWSCVPMCSNSIVFNVCFLFEKHQKHESWIHHVRILPDGQSHKPRIPTVEMESVSAGSLPRQLIHQSITSESFSLPDLQIINFAGPHHRNLRVDTAQFLQNTLLWSLCNTEAKLFCRNRPATA